MNMNAKTPVEKVTLEEVANACHSLLMKGERPTAARIQEFLGKGSTIGIGKLLKALQTQSADPAASTNQQQISLGTDNESIRNMENEAPLHEVPDATAEAAPPAKTAAPEGNEHQSAPHREFKIEAKPREHQHLDLSVPPVREEHLENLSENELIIKIRRLESMLAKEQSRREAAEKIAEQAKDYADTIKDQVALRINDLRENMATMIEQLKAEAKVQKENANQDLLFYREQLKAANQKLIELTGNA